MSASTAAMTTYCNPGHFLANLKPGWLTNHIGQKHVQSVVYTTWGIAEDLHHLLKNCALILLQHPETTQNLLNKLQKGKVVPKSDAYGLNAFYLSMLPICKAVTHTLNSLAILQYFHCSCHLCLSGRCFETIVKSAFEMKPLNNYRCEQNDIKIAKWRI